MKAGYFSMKGNSMKHYKYLLWDLDGTIVNTFEGITKSFAYALDSFGIKVNDLNELSCVIGPPLLDAFIDFYGFSEEDAHKGVEKYRERYNNTYVGESALYDGIKETIQNLSRLGYKHVLATAKPQHFAEGLLSHYGLIDEFHLVVGATLDKSRNNKIKVLEHIISTLGESDMSKMVMIGDREFDLLGADHFGIEAIGVLYGFGSYEELSSSPNIFLAKDAKDLYNYLK